MVMVRDNTVLATGRTVFPTDEKTVGRVHYMRDTQDVLQVMDDENMDSVIGLVRAGTCSFAAPLLSRGVNGLLTMEGEPQSHLGILSRDYTIPAIMSIEPQADVIDVESGSDEYFEEWGEYLSRRTVRLDCEDPDKTGEGKVIEVSE